MAGLEEYTKSRLTVFLGSILYIDKKDLKILKKIIICDKLKF